MKNLWEYFFFKMLSQFSSPFHSWDTPLDSPSRMDIPVSPRSNPPPLTSSSIKAIKELSQDHFQINSIKSYQIRSGLTHYISPPEQSPPDNNFLELKLCLATRSFVDQSSNQANSLQYSIRLICSYLRFRNYEAAIDASQTALNKVTDSGLIPFLGLLAAICNRSEAEEMIFFEAAEKSFYLDDDLPQFYRLIDELLVLRSLPESEIKDYHSPLINLILPDNRDLIKALKEKVHIFPRIGSDLQKLLIKYRRHKSQTHPQSLVEMLQIVDQAKENLPQLLPVCEGLSSIENSQSNTSKKPKARAKSKVKQTLKMKQANGNPTDKVLMLIQNREWKAAAAAATEYLEQNPDDADMLQHRAFALMNLYKNHDAIIDISKAISIKKTDRRLRMRAALWITLGERDLCDADLAAVEVKDPNDTKIESV